MNLVWTNTLADLDWQELSEFYRSLGFRRMRTAMAIFQNQADALKRGYPVDE